jgi:hypothetical protein
MTSQKKSIRKFKGMSYREIQSDNSKNRMKLKKDEQKWLKDNNYKNVGWNNVIELYQKIREILEKDKFNEMTLEELFLEADRIGNKYQTQEEIKTFNQTLAEEVNKIAESIDRQFPDTENEVIDFSDQNSCRTRKNPNLKTYRTLKI